jgi:hypothetical protein
MEDRCNILCTSDVEHTQRNVSSREYVWKVPIPNLSWIIRCPNRAFLLIFFF